MPLHRDAASLDLVDEMPLPPRGHIDDPPQEPQFIAYCSGTRRLVRRTRRNTHWHCSRLHWAARPALSPEFYKRLLDQLHDAVYFVDPRRCILYWNDAAERLTGYSRPRSSAGIVTTACSITSIRRAASSAMHECPLHRAMDQDHSVQDRVLLRHKDGRRISVDVRIMPVRNDEGSVIGGVEIFRDATSSVVVESAFRQIREAADRDPLTGLANRRYLDRMLARSLEQLERSDSPDGDHVRPRPLQADQ